MPLKVNYINIVFKSHIQYFISRYPYLAEEEKTRLTRFNNVGRKKTKKKQKRKKKKESFEISSLLNIRSTANEILYAYYKQI